MSLVHVTCIMVSHDSNMLDRVCTHIVTLTSSSCRSTRATCRTSSACTPRPRLLRAGDGQVHVPLPQARPAAGQNIQGPSHQYEQHHVPIPGAEKAQLRNSRSRSHRVLPALESMERKVDHDQLHHCVSMQASREVAEAFRESVLERVKLWCRRVNFAAT